MPGQPAAARDRQSFGCSNENDFTCFGEALLRDQLPESHSIPVAFVNAIAAINEREAAGQREPLHPQFFVGDEIAVVLDTLNRELPARVAQAELHGAVPGTRGTTISATALPGGAVP